MKDYILKDNKGNKKILRVKNNKVYVVKRKLKKEIRYILYILLVLLIVIIGNIIAYNILY